MADLISFDLLSAAAYEELRAADRSWVGTEHYLGVARFWHADYHTLLKEVPPRRRRLIHAELLCRLGADALGRTSLLHEWVLASQLRGRSYKHAREGVNPRVITEEGRRLLNRLAHESDLKRPVPPRPSH
jgi:hypothetical protein